MSFGAMLKNKNGTEIFGDHEDAYLYWGRASIGLNQPSTTLLNIRNEIPIITFYCNTAGATSPYRMDAEKNCAFFISPGDDGYKKISSRTTGCNVPYSGGFDVYVFAKVDRVPLPRYGMALYSSSGNVIFHTGRPPLRVVTFQSGTHATYNFKAAIPSGHKDRFSNWQGFIGSSKCELLNRGYVTSYRSGSQYVTSLNQTSTHRWDLPVGPSGPIAPPYFPYDLTNDDGFIPVIDGSFYDKYSNL